MKIENLVLFILLFFLVGFFVFSNLKPNEYKLELNTEKNITKENYTKYEIDTNGFIKVKINVDYILGNSAEISLVAGCYLIKATTDSFVAEAIIKGKEKKIEFRPTVYDVIVDVFKSLGIEVLGLKIIDIRNNTYIGQLILQQEDKVLFLDIRPSDGSAIAIRFDAPIYINESLAKKMGEYIC